VNILVRVDSSKEIGLGHVSRCLALLGPLRRELSLAPSSISIIQGGDGLGAQRMEREGFKVVSVGGDTEDENAFQRDVIKHVKPRAVIVDLPADPDRDEAFYSSLKYADSLLISINDANSGRFSADIIVEDDISKYPGMYGNLEKKKRFILGPKYRIINEVFAETHKKRKVIEKNAKRILVSFGGSDPAGLTEKSIDYFMSIYERMLEMSIDVIVTDMRLIEDKIKVLKEKSDCRITLHDDIEPAKMAELMFNADIGLISGGLTLYESACTGLPVIIISQNEEQELYAREFEKQGYGINLGMHGRESSESIGQTLVDLAEDMDKRVRFSSMGKKLIDGKGSLRVAEYLAEAIRS
jgi:spore coat polysaccharide biosynthesis predicted glycosyltransferase SpsG